MSRSTPCPDLVHLRLFFHKPTSFPAADSVRAHLAQCEVCRAIVAGLEAGDQNQSTLVDEAVVPTRRVVRSADAMELCRMSNIVAGLETGDKNQNKLAHEAVVPARRVMPSADTMEVFRVSTGDTAKSASDARVWMPVGEAEDGETLHLSDSLQVANIDGKNDPTETCCFMSGDDSSQIGAPDELCYILSGDDSSQIGASDATRIHSARGRPRSDRCIRRDARHSAGERLRSDRCIRLGDFVRLARRPGSIDSPVQPR